jgi:hypothetical protein
MRSPPNNKSNEKAKAVDAAVVAVVAAIAESVASGETVRKRCKQRLSAARVRLPRLSNSLLRNSPHQLRLPSSIRLPHLAQLKCL